jgi:hypothetical protein
VAECMRGGATRSAGSLARCRVFSGLSAGAIPLNSIPTATNVISLDVSHRTSAGAGSPNLSGPQQVLAGKPRCGALVTVLCAHSRIASRGVACCPIARPARGRPRGAKSQGIMAARCWSQYCPSPQRPSPARRREFAGLPRQDRRRQGSPFPGTCPKDDRSCQPELAAPPSSAAGRVQRRAPANLHQFTAAATSPPIPAHTCAACTPHSAFRLLRAYACCLVHRVRLDPHDCSGYPTIAAPLSPARPRARCLHLHRCRSILQ